MEKYEILLIIITLCFFSVIFRVSIKKLKIYKILEINEFNIFFISKRDLPIYQNVKKIVNLYIKINNYRLPDL